MSQRIFLKLSVSIGLILLFKNTQAQQKPNILWVTIEDTSPQFIGCYGNPSASTPVIDKLAKQGVRFSNAFSTGTVCSPSRSTLITGVRTFESGTGNHRSNFPLPAFVKGFPAYLRNAGYYTSNNSKTDYNVKNPELIIREAWNESSDKAGWEKRFPGQPFFSVFNFMDSHQSRTMTDSYDKYTSEVLDKLPAGERIGENAFPMPPFLKDSYAMRKQFARVYNSLKLTDNKIGALLQRLEKDHLTDSTIIFFYSDHGEGMPRGKTNGIGLGYRVPFIVWFPEMYKKLSPWGKGIVTDELIDFEDLAPTILSLAGVDVPAYMKGRVLLGSKRSRPVSFLELSSDRSDNGIDMVRSITNGRYVYSRNFMPFMPEGRYIRYAEISDIKQQMRADLKADQLNEMQKRVFSERPAEFLFDLANDPWEINNLAGNTAYGTLLDQMSKELDDQILRRRDIMLLPEYELSKISVDGTPYEFRLNDTIYPVQQIYAAAKLSGQRGMQVAKQQIQLLNSNNSIVRYWAITGLRSQYQLGLKQFQSVLMDAMKDNYPPVAVTAAAINWDLWGDKLAGILLAQFIGSDDMDIALMAINYILYCKNKDMFVQTVQSAHDNKNASYNVKAACMDFLGSLGLVPNTPAYEN